MQTPAFCPRRRMSSRMQLRSTTRSSRILARGSKTRVNIQRPTSNTEVKADDPAQRFDVGCCALNVGSSLGFFITKYQPISGRGTSTSNIQRPTSNTEVKADDPAQRFDVGCCALNVGSSLGFFITKYQPISGRDLNFQHSTSNFQHRSQSGRPRAEVRCWMLCVERWKFTWFFHYQVPTYFRTGPWI